MAERFTPKPWEIGEFDECGGYDCMYAGITVGPAELDGHSYGQKSCGPLSEENKARMIADAHLIAAAPDLYEVLNKYWDDNGGFFKGVSDEDAALIRAALSTAHPTQGDE